MARTHREDYFHIGVGCLHLLLFWWYLIDIVDPWLWKLMWLFQIWLFYVRPCQCLMWYIPHFDFINKTLSRILISPNIWIHFRIRNGIPNQFSFFLLQIRCWNRCRRTDLCRWRGISFVWFQKLHRYANLLGVSFSQSHNFGLLCTIMRRNVYVAIAFLYQIPKTYLSFLRCSHETDIICTTSACCSSSAS